MFSATVIGLIVAISAFTWIYEWTMRRTGNNTKSALTTAGVAAIISFGIVVTIIWTIDSFLSNK